MSLEAIRARNHQFPFEDITFLIGEVDRLQSGLTLKNLESKWLADGSVPKGAKLLEAWLRNGEIVVIGDPDEQPDHNCDAMGCTFWHVIYRAALEKTP
jgi:hypothetical protein